jgi:cytochrome c biogenesis protein CcmG, thiol:disulfide interchange protein DsbE
MVLAAGAILLGAVVALSLRQRYAPAASISPSASHLPAPDFNLSQLDGPTLRLSSYRDKIVLLDFWATWCAPCREETPNLVNLQKEYGDRGLQIIGVSMDDSAEPVHAFYRQFHMNYPVVMGNAKTGELYGGVLGLPIAFLIDRNGRIYKKHVGATDPVVLEKEINFLLGTR